MPWTTGLRVVINIAVFVQLQWYIVFMMDVKNSVCLALSIVPTSLLSITQQLLSERCKGIMADHAIISKQLGEPPRKNREPNVRIKTECQQKSLSVNKEQVGSGEETIGRSKDFRMDQTSDFADFMSKCYHSHFNKGVLKDPDESITAIIIAVMPPEKKCCQIEFICFSGAVRTIENFTKDIDGMIVCCKTIWLHNPELKCNIEKRNVKGSKSRSSFPYRLSTHSEIDTLDLMENTQHLSIDIVTAPQGQINIYTTSNGGKKVPLLQFQPEAIKLKV